MARLSSFQKGVQQHPPFSKLLLPQCSRGQPPACPCLPVRPMEVSQKPLDALECWRTHMEAGAVLLQKDTTKGSAPGSVLREHRACLLTDWSPWEHCGSHICGIVWAWAYSVLPGSEMVIFFPRNLFLLSQITRKWTRAKSWGTLAPCSDSAQISKTCLNFLLLRAREGPHPL